MRGWRKHRHAWSLVLATGSLALVVVLALTLVGALGEARVRLDQRSPFAGAARTRGRSLSVIRLSRRRPPPAVPAAQVSINADTRSVPIPNSFLGVSTEYWALPLLDHDRPLLERVLSLLKVPGDGALVLRIGGDSADHSFWSSDPDPTPSWVFEVTPGWLRAAAALVADLGARTIIDLNLVTDSPLQDMQWVRMAEQGFPPGSIAGFEIGNEPDLYARRFWLATLRRHWELAAPLPLNLTPARYVYEFDTYSRFLRPIAPKIPLVGPAVANPVLDTRWVTALLAAPHRGLRVVSGHWYPYSGCAPRRSPTYPTIGRLLSENATAGMASGIRPLVRAVHRLGLQFRLTEFNSVTCGGLRGVSDTFTTALWAPDALFELAEAGIDGVNVHVRVHASNAAFTIGTKGLQARPLLYGLVLFARTLGPSPLLLAVHVRATGAAHLKAWAVHVLPNAIHVLLIDKGRRPVRVCLRLPAAGPARMERLQAPSVSATAGVTLGGQRLGTDGQWHGPLRTQTILPGPRGYRLLVPGWSAALVLVRTRG